MTEMIHLSGMYVNGRQSCVMCGRLLVSSDPSVGASWPPPFPRAEPIVVDVEADESLRTVAVCHGDPWHDARWCFEA